MRENNDIVEESIEDNSERNFGFWRIMRFVNNTTTRAKMYGNYIRNKLFHTTTTTNNHIIDENENQENVPNPNPIQRKCSLKLKIIIGLIIFFIISAAIIITIFFFPKGPTHNIKKETFITGLTYKKNQIMKFQDIKTTKIVFDFGNISQPNANKTLIEYFDYTIGILDEDKVIEDNVEKEIFTGFIFLENYMIDNETDKMLLQNSSLLEDSDMKRNLYNSRNLKEKTIFNFSLNEIKPYCCIDNGTLPIMKFDFYRNGVIKKIYKPKNLIPLFYNRMNEILEKVIPDITKDHFNSEYNNITEAKEKEFEKIMNNTKEEDSDNDIPESDSFEEETFEEENERSRNRRLKSKGKISSFKFRKMEDNETDMSDYKFSEDEIYEILNQEFNTENDFDLNMYNNELSTEEGNDLNFTNLNYYSHSMVRNDYSEFKNSQQNVTINSKIDEKEKSLKEVHYNNKGRLVNDTNFEEELETERQKSCSNENLLDCNDLANDNEENIINSQFNTVEYEVFEDILSKGNYIDNSSIIGKMKNIFSEYENNTEIIDNQNSTFKKRLLRGIIDYFLANRFEFNEVEMEIGNINKNRRLDNDDSSYYGNKNMEYAKNVFCLNFLGLQMKLQVTNNLYVKTGETVVKLHLTFAFIKISITLKRVKTNMHLAIRNYNEMGYTELYLINESNDKLEQRNFKFSNIILDLEKNFSNFLINKYDFGDIFKESFAEMYEKIKEFTSEIFEELIEIIRNAYANYTKVLDDVKKDKHELFNEIRIITKKEYIDFIEKMLNSVEIFNNNTLIFLKNVEEEVAKIENFQLDLLYDLQDIIYESKKIFKDFNKNLFMAIEKGIKTFRLDFQDFVHEMIGNLLYLVDFLSVNLNKNEILKNSIKQEVRDEVTTKLKNMRNIINVIEEYLMNNIEKDYKEEMDESNINSIKIYSNQKLNEYLEDLEQKSKNIIEDIKQKIAFMNLYELYSDNIDKIVEISTSIKDIFNKDLYMNVIEKIKKLEPEYFNKNSLLIENRQKLFNVVNLIDSNINNEISEFNEYIIKFIEDFKIRRQYYIYYNIYNFRKSFLDESMDKLRKKFEKLINDTILISINNSMKKNYELGFVWLEEIIKRLKPLHKRDECLQTSFWNKYSKLIKDYQTFLPNAYSDEAIQIYKKYFDMVKNNILTTVRTKVKEINYYYLNSSIYKNNLNFIYQINNEIEYLISNLENYYNDDYFEMKLATYIYKFTSETLNPINDNLYKKFENLKKECEKYTDYTRNRNWGDYCWNNNRVLHKWHYYSVPHTNNYKLVDISLNNTENFIKNGTNKLINEFTEGITTFLEGYVNEIQTLFNDLYNYSEKKLNSNQALNSLIIEYNQTLYKMIEIADEDVELEKEDINYFIQNISEEISNVENEFFDNYYINNYTSYLEYPDEVLFEINILGNELESFSEMIKNQINYLINKKLYRVKKENQYFILKTHEYFSKLIELRIKYKKIFEYYKEYRLTENLDKILIEYNYTYINITEEYLNENIYDNKITDIIQNYKNIILKTEDRINNDWILRNYSQNN